MRITGVLFAEPGDIRRFVQQVIDHQSHPLAFRFILRSAEGSTSGQQIQISCISFYRQVRERITENNHMLSPLSSVVLHWLQEQHGGATTRRLLPLSQDLFCHPRASATADEACPQLTDLLQQTWRVISAGGQCRVERRFRATRPDTSEQYVALKTAVQSLISLVIATIIR